MLVEAVSLGDLRHVPELGPLHKSGIRAVHAERPVTAPAMVVIEVIDEDPPKVPLAENDDLVEALSTDAPDHPLDVGILLGTPWSREHFLDAQALHSRSKGRSVHAVAVPE
jgi:hypothetical protein